jgi:hypothetical protein
MLASSPALAGNKSWHIPYVASYSELTSYSMHELQYRFGTAARASLPSINNVKYQSAVASEPPLIVARIFQVNKLYVALVAPSLCCLADRKVSCSSTASGAKH